MFRLGRLGLRCLVVSWFWFLLNIGVCMTFYRRLITLSHINFG